MDVSGSETLVNSILLELDDVLGLLAHDSPTGFESTQVPRAFEKLTFLDRHLRHFDVACVMTGQGGRELEYPTVLFSRTQRAVLRARHAFFKSPGRRFPTYLLPLFCMTRVHPGDSAVDQVCSELRNVSTNDRVMLVWSLGMLSVRSDISFRNWALIRDASRELELSGLTSQQAANLLMGLSLLNMCATCCVDPYVERMDVLVKMALNSGMSTKSLRAVWFSISALRILAYPAHAVLVQALSDVLIGAPSAQLALDNVGISPLKNELRCAFPHLKLLVIDEATHLNLEGLRIQVVTDLRAAQMLDVDGLFIFDSVSIPGGRYIVGLRSECLQDSWGDSSAEAKSVEELVRDCIIATAPASEFSQLVGKDIDRLNEVVSIGWKQWALTKGKREVQLLFLARLVARRLESFCCISKQQASNAVSRLEFALTART